MTKFGAGAVLAGIAALVMGLTLDWLAFSLIGLGLLFVVLIGLLVVSRPSTLVIDREIAPPRVPKGSPAIAFLRFANRGRRTVPLAVATQPFGSVRVRTLIPRLRGGERGSRAYRLPTRERGVFDVEPIEVTRRDSFELFRRSRRYAREQRIWVYPRLLPMRPVPVGQNRNIEGPSSDASPQGNITFHRLREYAPGDDLRLVHWRSSARAGTLLVKHNVDTSQPYTVVVFDQRPGLYTAVSFEEAVDVAASVVSVSGQHRSPVELRTTSGTVLGGPRLSDTTPLVDHLTGIAEDADGSLQEQLLRLRTARGGTTLAVVTGELDPADLPHLSGLRRKFDRVVLVSVNPDSEVIGSAVEFGGVRVLVVADADGACEAWNLRVAP